MSFTAVVTFCWHLSSFSYRFRKALFTSARVQLYPTAHTRLYDAFYSELSEIVFVPGDPDLGRPDHTYTSGFETLSLVSSWLPSPVLSGFLSLLIREWPILDTSEVASIIESSIIKEFSAAQTDSQNASLNYSAWLSPGDCLAFRLNYNVPISIAQEDIRNRLSMAKRLLEAQLFFPSYNRKTIGEVARRNVRGQTYHVVPLTEPIETTLDLERIRFEYGIEPRGETAMRYSWKFNELKPRVYYARGPTAHYSSKYVQQIFNTIVDLFPATNRYTRFSIASLPDIDPDETLFVYDYAAFTSSLRELRNFTNALAVFFQGTTITVVAD